MALQQRNIGSVRHMSQSLQSRRASKKRRISDDLPANANNHNHNRRDPTVEQDHGVVHDLTDFATFDLPPKLEKKKKGDSQKPLRRVLNQLQDKLDLFERIQLDKKKVETSEITITKMEAMAQAMEEQYLTKPHLIGAVPSVSNQLEIAWNCWMMSHHETIFKTESIKEDVELFVTQLVSLKAADAEWREFLSRWQMLRILHQDEFNAVWRSIKKELNIPGTPVVELVEFSDEDENKDIEVSAQNDKAEL